MNSHGFQTRVYVNPAPAVPGDFASANPRATFLAGPGGLVAGDDGVWIGRFAWVKLDPEDPNGAPMIAEYTGTGAPAGFVHREQQGLITEFLAHAGMLIPRGFMVTLHVTGDFWALNEGTAAAVPGNPVFVDDASGAVNFDGAGEATWFFAMSKGEPGDIVKITSTPYAIARPANWPAP